MNYQVGDLFCPLFDEKVLFIITRGPEKDEYSQDVYFITCISNCRTYAYNKEGLEFTFKKVA